MLSRWRRELRDLLQMVLAPGLPTLLPWRVALFVLRQLSRLPWLYRAQVEASLAAIRAQWPDCDEPALRRRLRLVRLLDSADLYWVWRTPLHSAPGGHFRRVGEWPAKGPFIAVSFHYGNGMWMLRDAQRSGLRTVVIAAPFEEAMFAGRRVELFYAKRRWQEMDRSAGAPSAFRPRIRPKLVAALEAGQVVMGLLDIPPALVPSRQLPVRLLDQAATLPCGLLDLAHALKVPVVPYWVRVDAAGRRCLHVQAARPVLDPEAELHWFAEQLDRLIRDDPAAWHFWPQWPQWLNDAAALAAAHAESAAQQAKP